MLTALGPDIWTAEGGPVSGAGGFRFPTRMVVIRLDDGGLVLWSPVERTGEHADAVAALGPVVAIVGPNSLHHTFLADWAAAFPDARLCAAPRLAAARPDLDFGITLGEAPPPLWAGQIEQLVLKNRITDEVVLFHRQSGTAIFTDVIQQMPGDWFSGWRALVARLDLMTGPVPAVPRKFRMGFTDRRDLRAKLQVMRGWPVERLVMAHGPVVDQSAAAALDRAFSWVRT